MNRRARTTATLVAFALACGFSVVALWRQRAIAPTAPRERGAARMSSRVRSLPMTAPAEVAVAAPPPITSVAAPSKSSSGTGFDEEELMRLLRSARDKDPTLAIQLAREGNRRFPGSPDAPERASVLIHALAEQGHSSEARGEAEDMVNRYPDSAWVREVERFTGAHRHRNSRLGPDGELYSVDPAPPT